MDNDRNFAVWAVYLRAVLVGAVTLTLLACSHNDNLVRPPDAMTPQRSSQSLLGESAGVRVVAKMQTWHGDPPTLSRYVLPVWVQIDNHSGKALLLRYRDISMASLNDGQVTLAALVPAMVKGKATIPVADVPPEFGLQDTWMGTWLEPDFDDHLASRMSWQENLPTKEMLRRAIREGVVADGKKVAGFVYFPRPKQDPAALTLRADLVDAATQLSFARVEIPLAIVLENFTTPSAQLPAPNR